MGIAHRTSLLLVALGTGAAWFVWVATIAWTDPATAGAAGFALFYLALFAAIAGSVGLIGVWVRRRAPDPSRALAKTVRHSGLTGLAVVCAVLLESRDLLTWLNLAFLVVALTLLELFLLSLRRGDRPLRLVRDA